MTCGMCKHCVPLDICGGDCECKAREIEVSEDDDTRFYGEDNEPCELFVTAQRKGPYQNCSLIRTKRVRYTSLHKLSIPYPLEKINIKFKRETHNKNGRTVKIAL